MTTHENGDQTVSETKEDEMSEWRSLMCPDGPHYGSGATCSICGMPTSCHPGHRYYVGGSMDGTVQHLVYTTPSDYPQTVGTLLRDGQRSWYEIDYEASVGTEAVYRFVGLGRTIDESAR